jgi:hypothetical protein
MQVRKRYIFLGIVCLGVLWFVQNKAIDYYENKNNNPNLAKLKSLDKFVVWNQDFLLHNLDIKDSTHNFLNNAIVSGKIAFAIDLADSIHTTIIDDKNTITITAPLQISYINYDVNTLILISDASANKALNLTKRQVIKYLDQKTLEQYLPLVTDDMQHNALSVPQQKLSDLTGKLVKINLTKMPQISDWN